MPTTSSRPVAEKAGLPEGVRLVAHYRATRSRMNYEKRQGWETYDTPQDIFLGQSSTLLFLRLVTSAAFITRVINHICAPCSISFASPTPTRLSAIATATATHWGCT